MSDTNQADRNQLLKLTADIVAAHVSQNTVSADALPGLIAGVYGAFAGAGTAQAPAAEQLHPAVPIKRSIHEDYLICLEDGAKMKMLKRYLAKRYNLTPAQYRERWGLPSDYPMVAPGYAARRSTLAKEIGLGRQKAAPAADAAPAPEQEEPPVTPKRGRPKGSGRKSA